MIDTLPTIPASFTRRVLFVLQGIGAESTDKALRLIEPSVGEPSEEETADFGQSDLDDPASLMDIYGRAGSTSTPPFRSKWEAELRKLEMLRQGWNGYDAPIPTTAAIEKAGWYLQVVTREGFEPKRVEPSVMGGVGITHRQGN